MSQRPAPASYTIRLPRGIVATVVQLRGDATTDLLRAASHAEIYLLFGNTRAESHTPAGSQESTGPGFYVGMSAVLRQELRAGVSLRQWSTQRARLEPKVAILMRSTYEPLEAATLRVIETHLIRELWTTHTMLNTQGSCPTAARTITRAQTMHALQLAYKLADVARERAIGGAGGTPTGGTIHERIVRLVRTRGPMLTTEIVAAAASAGIRLEHHGDPTATVRRDGATRERDSRGPTRIYHTSVLANGRRTGLFYPPSFSRALAVQNWRERTADATQPPAEQNFTTV